MWLEIGNDMTDMLIVLEMSSLGSMTAQSFFYPALIGKCASLSMFKLAVLAWLSLTAFEQQRLQRRLRWLKQQTDYTTWCQIGSED